ncbi:MULTISPECIES: DUF3597 domain-containing protein [Agrobacterium tumefaciens complex]|jgi:hypothetical protein|uniref:DUF3597 domain-containing protein n=2 Tax=Agrobacterium tumefaciens complex TaxID=1183400 RepID=A0AAP9E8S9_AGRTU|nr:MULTISPECIES: DUF3597 domain-containing protein [Agrobacterium tumefaciens complex]MCP2136581.1 3-oxoacyl-ACP reductase-like protein [Rhizobium sp. SLBN-94]TGE77139.1 DUF3597 domain-containing protein [Rhizobium sp. SEMIA 439]EHH03744.1 hypothetical protein ATCR1_20153 [Agrobacterium tumefaciens CCNWGS0286]KAA1233398.1 DUF3597 domain-containing protein [Agrobacterium tumefaciens]KAB0457432.1 DUF3597 domain-containing protein [Agrobacterium tumefaciens]
MSFFDKIKNAIFGKAEAAPQTSAPAGTPPTTASPTAASPASPAPTAAAPAPTGNVDVASILDAAVKKNGQKLDWKHSIVDLLKALDLDSSLTARKELAGELGYTGDTSDSATMNIWLHKAVIKKLSENGGKVPADLLD